MTPPIPNSYWLEAGRILCGEYPREFDDREDHEGMAALLRAGVREFVDLTGEGELKPYSGIARETARSLGIDPGELAFHEHPIPDMGVPEDGEMMRAILRTIRLARHRHRTVYLHCWGGRGRTGTVAGCVLKDLLRLSGEETLLALAARWFECAKANYSDSPETDEQRDFVRRWNPEKRALTAAVRSAILGATIGGALGTSESPGHEHAGKRGRPEGTPRTWSEDTCLLLATMAGFLAADRYSPDAVMSEFVAWFREGRHTPRGATPPVGEGNRKAIERYLGGSGPGECGVEDGWFGEDGAVARVLPVALACGDDPDLMEKAWEIGALTHARARPRMYCAFHCLVASELLHASSLADAADFAWRVMDARWSFLGEDRACFDRLRPDRLFGKDRAEDVRDFPDCGEQLGVALWINERHDHYRDAILHARDGGFGEATTCLTGGLAGLLHGERDIPEAWLERLPEWVKILDLAERFAAFSLRRSRGSFSKTAA